MENISIFLHTCNISVHSSSVFLRPRSLRLPFLLLHPRLQGLRPSAFPSGASRSPSAAFSVWFACGPESGEAGFSTASWFCCGHHSDSGWYTPTINHFERRKGQWVWINRCSSWPTYFESDTLHVAVWTLQFDGVLAKSPFLLGKLVIIDLSVLLVCPDGDLHCWVVAGAIGSITCPSIGVVVTRERGERKHTKGKNITNDKRRFVKRRIRALKATTFGSPALYYVHPWIHTLVEYQELEMRPGLSFLSVGLFYVLPAPPLSWSQKHIVSITFVVPSFKQRILIQIFCFSIPPRWNVLEPCRRTAAIESLFPERYMNKKKTFRICLNPSFFSSFLPCTINLLNVPHHICFPLFLAQCILH